MFIIQVSLKTTKIHLENSLEGSFKKIDPKMLIELNATLRVWSLAHHLPFFTSRGSKWLKRFFKPDSSNGWGSCRELLQAALLPPKKTQPPHFFHLPGPKKIHQTQAHRVSYKLKVLRISASTLMVWIMRWPSSGPLFLEFLVDFLGLLVVVDRLWLINLPPLTYHPPRK